MKLNIVIIGTNVSSVHVTKFINEYNLFNIIGYAVDAAYKDRDSFFDKPVYAIEDLPNIIDKEKDMLYVAILWNHLNGDRRRMYERLKAQGYKFANIISPRALIRGELRGDNIWIEDFAKIQFDAVVGSDCVIREYAMLADNATLGDHCFMGVKSVIAGGCTVGEQTFVGINATVFDDRKIGKKCLIGASAAVKRDMPDFSAWKSSSDFVIRQYEEDVIESKLMFLKNKH